MVTRRILDIVFSIYRSVFHCHSIMPFASVLVASAAVVRSSYVTKCFIFPFFRIGQVHAVRTVRGYFISKRQIVDVSVVWECAWCEWWREIAFCLKSYRIVSAGGMVKRQTMGYAALWDGGWASRMFREWELLGHNRVFFLFHKSIQSFIFYPIVWMRTHFIILLVFGLIDFTANHTHTRVQAHTLVSSHMFNDLASSFFLSIAYSSSVKHNTDVVPASRPDTHRSSKRQKTKGTHSHNPYITR